MRTLLFVAAVGLIGAADRPCPPSTPATTRATAELASFHVPFHIGEKLTYAARVNFMGAGGASMSVEDISTVRGHPTYHTVFDVKGHVLFFHVDDHYESWFDTTTLVSLHHVQHIDETSYHNDKVYDFYPDRRVYVRNGHRLYVNRGLGWSVLPARWNCPPEILLLEWTDRENA